MSSIPSSYSSPPPKPGEFAPAAFEIQYLRAFHYITENPNWAANVGWCVLLVLSHNLVPFVGPIMLLGYLYDVTESLCRTRGMRYPDFTIDRLGDYLMRGLWPTLVNLVGSFGVLALLSPFIIGAIALGALGLSASNQQGNGPGGDLTPVLTMCGAGLVGLLGMLVAFVAGLYLMPMILRTGLTQSFNEGFNFTWARDFVARTWFEMILVSLFTMAASLVLMLVGLLICFVGILFMPVFGYFAWAHTSYQLYMLYLSRGGEPIPLKAPPPPSNLPPANMPPKPSFPPQ